MVRVGGTCDKPARRMSGQRQTLERFRVSGMRSSRQRPSPAASVARTVLEHIGFAVDGENDRALGGMRLVERADPPPHELAGAADAVMVGERSFDDVALIDLRMLVHRQRRARRPFEEAGHLALRLVLIEDLDRDAWELRRFPFHLLGPDINRPADCGLHARSRPGWFRRFRGLRHRHPPPRVTPRRDHSRSIAQLLDENAGAEASSRRNWQTIRPTAWPT